MILYCIVTCLFMFGLILESADQDDKSLNIIDVGAIIIAPVLVPIFLGIAVAEKLK